MIETPLTFDIGGVSFDYEGIAAIRNLSLQIGKGERIALLGANGSGKSTLLRILDGLYFPKAGFVNFQGEALTPERLQRDGFALTFRREVALVFQNPDVQLFNPTVFDEVAYGPLQLRWEKEELIRRVGEIMAFMGILDLKERSPYRLSGGEKKRVALASVLVLDPDVLLLDEPTVALDPRSQSQIVDLIQQWRGTNKTVVTATHQLEIVEDIADRVLVLEAGTVIAAGTPSEVLSNEQLLVRANLVHSHRHSHGGVVHSHPHRHGHSHDEHAHGPSERP
ncbi:MAG TPA: ATP-binding cassette domain-containing protein [Terriglobales bacterium]|nr:ATP-binding cassette domain-containing protein [Terriglobales bacterium]HVO61921.1 ATP-binding cassette domain-containing protein [Terriglobales bacterium]HXJ91043.1 ATP-binding cassette domain-containing protein [Candidatus Binatia bacterium]